MAPSSHEEDAVDESYAPDSEDDSMGFNIDITDADSENERESNRGSIMMDFENVDMHTALTEDEGPFSGYISQSSCHSLNTGSDSEGVSYHMTNKFDGKKQWIIQCYQLDFVSRILRT